MSYLSSLAKNNTVEHITIVTNGNIATSGVLQDLSDDGISDIIIQNLSEVACYITFSAKEDKEVTGKHYHLFLAAKGEITLRNASFANFSALRAISSEDPKAANAIIRITAVG